MNNQETGQVKLQRPQRNTDVQEIDLLALFFEFKKRILLILAVTLIGGIVGTLFTKVLMTPYYKSTCRVYVISADSSLSSLVNLQFSTQLTNDYEVLVTDRTVMESVIDELNLDTTYQKLRAKISLNNPKDTRILDITVTDTDPMRAKQIADAVAQKSSDFIADIMETDPPKIIETGEIPTLKSGPSTTKNAAMAAMAACCCVLGLITLQYLMNDTVKTEDDVINALGVSVIAAVPLYHKHSEGDKDGKKEEGKTDRPEEAAESKKNGKSKGGKKA